MAPAHSNFEHALAGVTAFASAVPSDSDEERTRSKKPRKDKAKKEKNSKKSSKFKESSKKKRKRKRSSSTDEDNNSGSDQESLEVKLARGRAAVKCIRTIMSRMPQAKQSTRQMLWRLDHREAVDISTIPDTNLKKLLEVAFDCLKLLKVKEGVYVKGDKGESLLRQLGHVLDEVPAELPLEGTVKNHDLRNEATNTDEAPSNAGGSTAYTAETPPESIPEIGVALPEDWRQEPSEGLDEHDSEESEKLAELANPSKRVLGPALPPQILLDQAAEVAEAMAAEEEAAAAAALIGPPPPEMVEEAEAVPGDERAAEVVRILNILQAAKIRGRKEDAYQVVGLEADCKAGEVKKRYWKLSLLIHPDKCSHPRAQDAFNALSQAAKDLQDAGKRAGIDREIEKHSYEEFEAEELKQQEVARQWRVLRGEASTEDMQGPKKSGPAVREEWITVLPASRRPSAPSQKSQTSFSQQGVAAINQDATEWADTPQRKLLRLQQAGEAMMPALVASAEQERTAAKAKVVDAYNEARRAKPLVEQHADEVKKKKRRKLSKHDKPNQEEQAAWEGSHPWRPFDREKDLQEPKASSQAELMKKMGDLGSRFGSGKAESRKFL